MKGESPSSSFKQLRITQKPKGSGGNSSELTGCLWPGPASEPLVLGLLTRIPSYGIQEPCGA